MFNRNQTTDSTNQPTDQLLKPLDAAAVQADENRGRDLLRGGRRLRYLGAGRFRFDGSKGERYDTRVARDPDGTIVGVDCSCPSYRYAYTRGSDRCKHLTACVLDAAQHGFLDDLAA